MKKSYLFIIFLSFLMVGAVVFVIVNNLNYSNNNNTHIDRISTNLNTTISNKHKNNTINNNSLDNSSISPKTPVETELSSFSTKIYTKDSERQNNITIACRKLNDTVVNNGETFSFCDTLGPATSAEGYQEADIFIDGEVTQALGGRKMPN